MKIQGINHLEDILTPTLLKDNFDLRNFSCGINRSTILNEEGELFIFGRLKCFFVFFVFFCFF